MLGKEDFLVIQALVRRGVYLRDVARWSDGGGPDRLCAAAREAEVPHLLRPERDPSRVLWKKRNGVTS